MPAITWLVWTFTDTGEDGTIAVGVVRECFGARCLGKGLPNESQSLPPEYANVWGEQNIWISQLVY